MHEGHGPAQPPSGYRHYVQYNVDLPLKRCSPMPRLQVIVQLLAVAAMSSAVNILAGVVVMPSLASSDLSACLARTLLTLGHSVGGQASEYARQRIGLADRFGAAVVACSYCCAARCCLYACSRMYSAIVGA